MTLDELLMVLWIFAPTYLFWSGAHELSHLAVIESTVGTKSCEVALTPHTNGGTFYFGRTSCRTRRRPTRDELAAISLAGWGPGLIAINMLPLANHMTKPGVNRIAWYTFWGAGVVSVLYNAARSGPGTDGDVAGKAMGIPSWSFRPIVIVSAISSMAVTYWINRALN